MTDIAQSSESADAGPGSTESAGSNDAATNPPTTGVDEEAGADGGERSGSVEIGDEFDGTCTVAWPTAPMHTSDGTQIRTTCAGMESSGFQFVDILVLDPELDVTPSRPTVRVHGQVVDIVESEMGFTTLAVVADEATVR